MIRKHLLNPREFWGEGVLPSIARDDPAFKDQSYWRGRIWAPMNFLVYEGLLNYSTPLAVETRRQLADRSMQLFMHEWKEKGHVHENYSAVSDDSDNGSEQRSLLSLGSHARPDRIPGTQSARDAECAGRGGED